MKHEVFFRQHGMGFWIPAEIVGLTEEQIKTYIKNGHAREIPDREPEPPKKQVMYKVMWNTKVVTHFTGDLEMVNRSPTKCSVIVREEGEVFSTEDIRKQVSFFDNDFELLNIERL